MLPSGNSWAVLASETGQASFAATDAEEFALLERLAETRGHVTVEDVLSAGGLQEIHAMIAEKEGTAGGLPAAEIIALGEHEHEATARKAIEMFVEILARVAGDATLALGARGGLYLGGGMAPRMIDELKRSIFQLAFRSRVCTAARPEPVPVHVIMSNDAGLRGVAAALSDTYPMVRGA